MILFRFLRLPLLLLLSKMRRMWQLWRPWAQRLSGINLINEAACTHGCALQDADKEIIKRCIAMPLPSPQ